MDGRPKNNPQPEHEIDLNDDDIIDLTQVVESDDDVIIDLTDIVEQPNASSDDIGLDSMDFSQPASIIEEPLVLNPDEEVIDLEDLAVSLDEGPQDDVIPEAELTYEGTLDIENEDPIIDLMDVADLDADDNMHAEPDAPQTAMEETSPHEEAPVIDLMDVADLNAADDTQAETDTPQPVLKETVPQEEGAVDAPAFVPAAPFPPESSEEPIPLSDQQIEAALERVIEKVYGEKIEQLMIQAIEKTIKEEIERIKQALLDDSDPLDV
ncbi:MAG: hypothetical protein CSA23_06010 [Deltaproteobacteria bacterium]|nr:MAG: hypothetical protein CSA23_06010 [Deltaproteobacteria bacterium]